jgi:hypothetical protein
MATTYQLKFRRRYNLPPTDPRFLNATLDDIITDCLANDYADDPKLLTNVIEDTDFDLEEVLKDMGNDDWEEVKL